MKKRSIKGLLTTIIGTLALIFGSVAVAAPAHADTTLCTSTGSNFAPCNNSGRTSHGYESHYTSSYWNAYSGHNCTNYVGYMLTQNGDAGHGVAMGNATKWDNTINLHPEWGYSINTTATVGSIAQWEGNDNNPTASPGHVAYVEAVSGNTITVSEDNVILGGVSSYRWRTITTGGDWPTRFLHIKDTATTAPTDTDGDGTPDSSDLLPNVAGAIKNRGVPIQTSNLGGDFNGDGYQDIAIFYGYGASQTKLIVYYGTGGGNFASPMFAWDSGVGNWEFGNTKPLVGDFTGDGKTDIAAFYDYGNDRVKLFVFEGTTSGVFVNPVVKWDSGTGNNDWKRLMPVVGDFDGDGDQDVAAFYDYGNSLTKLLKWPNDGVGNFAWPSTVWDSGAGNWDWYRAKPVVGDFTGDGKTDIAAFYDYGGARTKILLFTGASGSIANPSAKWDSGAGNHEWDRTMPFAGDFNGDTKQDITLLYDYGNSTSRFLTLFGDGTGALAWPTASWASGTGDWAWGNTRGVVSDFSTDGKSDIVAFYNYGGGQVKLWEFNGSSAGTFSSPSLKWDSGVGNHEWANFLVP